MRAWVVGVRRVREGERVGGDEGARRARDARRAEACAAANGTSGARSCRFGVVEAYVEERLKEMSGGDPGKMCRSSDLAGSPADARVSDECARTLGSVFMAMYQYDDVKSRERCDLIAEDSFKRLCVASVDEEKTRRDIDLRAAVPFCTPRSLKRLERTIRSHRRLRLRRLRLRVRTRRMRPSIVRRRSDVTAPRSVALCGSRCF